MPEARYRRFVEILASARTPFSKQQLSERLDGTHVRTISRYLDRLADESAHLERHLDGKVATFKIRDSFQLPGQWFNSASVRAFGLMLELIEQLDSSALKQEFVALTHELKRLAKSAVGSSDLVGKIIIKQAAQRPISSHVMTALTRAIIEQVRVTIHYRARGEALPQTAPNLASPRTLSPVQLELYRNNWYLLAWCHAQSGYRYFALERVADVCQLAAPATVGSALPTQRGYGIFDLAASNSAHLRFSPFRAQWVADEIWHTEQVDTLLPNGGLERQFPYGNATELVRDLMREGADVQVLAPNELRNAVLAGHRKALESQVVM